MSVYFVIKDVVQTGQIFAVEGIIETNTFSRNKWLKDPRKRAKYQIGKDAFPDRMAAMDAARKKLAGAAAMLRRRATLYDERAKQIQCV